MKEYGIVKFLKYDDVLQAIRNTKNHLLIGNGFNRGLAVDTSYKNIFHKMLESDNSVYADAREIIEKCNYDLEAFIGELIKIIPQSNVFLEKYINNKIKLDFMRAAQEIVKSEVRKVYSEEKKGVFLLLSNFTNYFTLNYDSLVYLLLMKYKPANDMIIALQPTLDFQKGELDTQHNRIYHEIKAARDKGTLGLQFGEDEEIVSEPLKTTKKASFTMATKEYAVLQNKGWTTRDIERAVDIILEEEKDEERITSADDGFRLRSLYEENEYAYDVQTQTQNLFFLHGAFHIYKDGKEIKKITQKSDKALYDRLEETLNNDNKELVCVFRADGKEDEINKNEYLKLAQDKLSSISGTMVIIGCSFSDNDQHIFNQINRSNITTLYISVLPPDLDSIYKNAKLYFPEKRIIMFDASTISYKFPEELFDNSIGEERVEL